MIQGFLHVNYWVEKCRSFDVFVGVLDIVFILYSELNFLYSHYILMFVHILGGAKQKIFRGYSIGECFLFKTFPAPGSPISIDEAVTIISIFRENRTQINNFSRKLNLFDQKSDHGIFLITFRKNLI